MDDEIFSAGADAYGQGIARDDCPHPADSDEREVWQDGWDEAKSAFEDEETKDNV